ncbi:MAG TPA: amidohydrolase [Steroidobacteraceae bacterium]
MTKGRFRAVFQLVLLGCVVAATDAASDLDALHASIDRLADQVEPHVIANRRYIHQHPELSNRETETAAYIAERLRALGLEVHTGIAKTGVVAVLRGGKPGPVVALRSELDALPVTEEVDLPFKSTVRSTFNGKEVGVMHACGHDAHMGMLLGVAEIFSQLRPQLHGTVKFIFQPAEEGAPSGEEGGAALMVKEGVLSDEPKPEVIFGLHAWTTFEAGQIAWRAGGIMAGADDLKIVVRGRSTHGAMPWNGVDPIVVASQIVLGLQTIASRQVNVTKAPVIVTIGTIDGGVRSNIIPDAVTMLGTVRTLDPQMHDDVLERVRRTAEGIAAASGATAEVTIGADVADPITYNDPAFMARMLPTLARVAGAAQLVETTPFTPSEDFSIYQQHIPGIFFFLGVRKPGASMVEYAPNHSPRFRIDESALKLGVRALANLTVDYQAQAR